jgi:hypothetical protein
MFCFTCLWFFLETINFPAEKLYESYDKKNTHWERHLLSWFYKGENEDNKKTDWKEYGQLKYINNDIK